MSSISTIVVCEAQVPFVWGGAEVLVRELVAQLRHHGYRTELVSVPVQIDEDTLTKVAEATGGRYFRATDLGGLREIYGAIDRLERTEIDETQSAEPAQLYGYLVALAMLAIALAVTLRLTALRRLP